jgi:GTP cyclohydrolase I
MGEALDAIKNGESGDAVMPEGYGSRNGVVSFSPQEAAVWDMIQEFAKACRFDPTAEGLKDTPQRVAKAYINELLRGYRDDPEDILTEFEPEGYDGMIMDTPIPFYSLCELHWLPFHGNAAVGYIPDKKIVGISKLARVVDTYSRRLQNQERLTMQICNLLERALSPKGVIVVMKAEHMCKSMRGVRSQGKMITSSVTGVFKDNDRDCRTEFLRLIGQ